MLFQSTKNNSPKVNVSTAIKTGLAPDGGLYVPESFPDFSQKTWEKIDLQTIALEVLKPFFKKDPLENKLPEIVKQALTFDTPLRFSENGSTILELFHGPTCAFKDVGARFLAGFLEAIGEPKTILVATSGDTGGAVASAFYQKSLFRVGIFFPKGGVSPLQEKQLTCWGDNILSFSVNGVFDDCQKLVKEAFGDAKLTEDLHLTSANSISIGRLLPQTIYYAYSSLLYTKQKGTAPSYSIPSGNVGNAAACFWAKKMGFPIDKVLLATNSNDVIPKYLSTGNWEPKASVSTIANAMDVGNPSNMERLFALYPDVDALKNDTLSLSVSDSEIRQEIKRAYQEENNILCPHTAVASLAVRKQSSQNWIIVATAHPAKFKDIVEPEINHQVPTPASLEELNQRPTHVQNMDPTLTNLRKMIPVN